MAEILRLQNHTHSISRQVCQPQGEPVDFTLPAPTGIDAKRRATAPSWAKDLVIYELNPRAFTSPQGAGDGSGSGTFRSLAERLPYLADLGVNGVWMAGHHLSTHHFYGIWTVYAADRPDRIDPVLGSEDDLKALTAAARDHGIRIFLDVIAHGVVNSSSLITEHPEWFLGGTWGMTDYNYNDPGFREWWISLWERYALEFGIDGFRIDVNMVDPTIWDEIRERIERGGKKVVIFPEIERYHFSQQDLQNTPRDVYRIIHVDDLAGIPRGLSVGQASCHDYGWECLAGNHFYAKGSRAKIAHGSLLTPRIPLMFAGEEFNADPTPLPSLTQGLFGAGEQGGWLYGNQLDWSQLDKPEKQAMLHDVKTMLGIRKHYSHLLHGDSSLVTIASIPCGGESDYVPFALHTNGEEALVIVTNSHARDIEMRLALPFAALGFEGRTSLVLTDVVSGERFIATGDRVPLVVPIKADFTPGGGYRVLLVTPE
ncbi:MAG: hypothetical protein F2556_02045 [Actinobacteria bacterium]|nr:hypothetical protein [Actinomycetota bacterium]